MTNLSIMTIIGATIVAAEAPETKSATNRRPKFFVFHTLGSDAVSGVLGVRDMIFDDASKSMGVAGDLSPGVCEFIVSALILEDDATSIESFS